MSRLLTIVLWTCIGFFTACISILSATHLYFYFYPPIPTGTYRDPYLSTSHMFILGPITLWDEQVLIVFGLVFVTSLALLIFAMRQFYLQFDNTEKSAK